jgi:hypothetical protein
MMSTTDLNVVRLRPRWTAHLRKECPLPSEAACTNVTRPMFPVMHQVIDLAFQTPTLPRLHLRHQSVLSSALHLPAVQQATAQRDRTSPVKVMLHHTEMVRRLARARRLDLQARKARHIPRAELADCGSLASAATRSQNASTPSENYGKLVFMSWTLADSHSNHESEKQYQCQYCPNRFKNKNEAERHQNSLHLRRYSWSCAALHSPHTAFHPSTMTIPSVPTAPDSPNRTLPAPNSILPAESSNGSAAHDICGYCGKAFPNPPNWDLRSEHLVHEHKFGECNQHKKFFRADHFRQHLKHSHQAGSGKWTNVLENTCMKDEPMPVALPNRGRQYGAPISAAMGPGSMGPSMALGPQLPPPGALPGMPHA